MSIPCLADSPKDKRELILTLSYALRAGCCTLGVMEMAWKNPVPTVDLIIRIRDQIVLIERKNPPHGWALPGGFVDYGETVEAAAVREAEEETGLDARLEQLFYVYSNPARDPRQHTLSVVFIAIATGVPRGMDDANEARCFHLDALPSPLVFDHGQIIADFKHFLTTGQRPSPIDRQG